MKRILLFLVLLVSLKAFSQTPTGFVKLNSKTSQIGFAVDSFLYLPIRDTGYTAARIGAASIRPADSIVYYWNGTKWNQFGTLSSVGGGISQLGDSPFGLLKLNDSTYYVDSMQVITKYQSEKSRDSLGALIALKLNISDTASMLSTYVQRQELIDTAAAIRGDFPAGGGGSYSAGVGLTLASTTFNLDTATVSGWYYRQSEVDNRLALKWSLSDTAAKTWDWGDITGTPDFLLSTEAVYFYPDSAGTYPLGYQDNDTVKIRSISPSSSDNLLSISSSGSTSADLKLNFTLNTLPNNSVGSAQITNGSVGDAELATGIDAAKIGDGSVSNTEYQYLNGVTSAIQTQLDGKISDQWTLQTARFYVDSGRVGSKVRYDIVQNVFNQRDTTSFFGDSQVNPGTGNTSIDSTAGKRWVDLDAGTKYVNYATAGRGVWNQASSANANLLTGMTRAAWINVGLNDYRRQTDLTKTKNKNYWGHNSIIGAIFLKQYADAGGSGVTRGGSWTTSYVASSVGGRSSNGAYSASSGATMSYTADGRYYIIQCIASDGVTYSQGGFAYDIDGGASTNFVMNGIYDAVSDGANDNGRGPAAIIIDAGTYGTHTVNITVNIAANTPIDFIGVLKDPSECYPVLVADPAYLNSTGYATSPANASDVILDTASAVLGRMISENWSDYPVRHVFTNSSFNVSTGLDADGIHTNDQGDRDIFEGAVLDAWSDYLSDTAHFENGDFYRTFDRFYTKIGGIKKTIAFTTDIASGLSDGSNGDVQVSDGASGFSAATGVQYFPSANVLLRLTAQATGDNILSTKGFSGQTADHYTAYSSTSAVLNRISAGGGMQILGALTSPTGSGGFELEVTGGSSYITSYNRGGSAWYPLVIRGSTVTFQSSGTTRLLINGANITWTLGSDATGDTWYRNGSGFFTRLGIGSTGQVMKVSGGVPVWGDIAATATYSPTIGAVTNISATTGYTTYYVQLGDWVYVWGEFDATATSGLTASELYITLPAACDIVNSYDLSGSAIFSDNTALKISGDATNNRAKVEGIPQTTSSNKYTFSFKYRYIAP